MVLGRVCTLLCGVLLCVLPSLLAQSVMPPFPQLPNQFITEVEANILNKNRTVQVTEYYDEPGNRGRIEVFSNGSRRTDIFNYALQLRYRVVEDNRTCSASRFVPSSRPSLFTTFGPNGLAHIQSVVDFFRFGEKYHDSYNGTGTARGILCDIYTSSVVNTTSNQSMRWYFAARPTWNLPLGLGTPSTAVPVRLELEGYRPNFDPVTRMPTNETHYYNHIYEFVNFRLGTPDEHLHLFDTPHGIPCAGQPFAKSIPTLPDQFSVDFQTILQPNGTSYFSVMGYDRTKQAVGYFFNYAAANGSSQQGNYGLHHMIHNFYEGTEYNVTRSGCTVKKLDNNTLGNDHVLDHGKIVIAPANKVFGFELLRNVTYEGEREVDGYLTDVWMVTRNDVMMVPSAGKDQPSIWEYYFTKSSWQYNDLSTTQLHQVLVRVEGHSLLPGLFDTYKWVNLLSNFQVGPPRRFFFDNTICFNSSSASTAQFVLPTSYNGIGGNWSINGILSSVLGTVMNVSRSRFHVNTFANAQNQVMVSVRVHDVPSVGDPDRLKTLTSLSAALNKLKTAVNSGSLRVDFGQGPVTASQGSFSNTAVNSNTSPIPAVNGQASSSSSGSYSSGALAGVAIGMLLVGLLMGGTVAYLLLRRMRSDSVTYKREVD